jgi:hypothetical protein
MDAAEISYRRHMAALLDASELQVGAGEMPDWIKEHFCCEHHLAQITETAGLPPEAAVQLLTIAVFLDMAFLVAPRRRKGPKALARELNSLKSAHRNLLRRVSSISPEAYACLCRVNVTIDEAGEPSGGWEGPPVQETQRILKDLGNWLDQAEIPSWRPGPRKSPKFYAILILRDVLQEHYCEVVAGTLTYLAEQVVEPIADHHGDDGSLEEFIKEVLGKSQLTGT